ncbi:374_t:CDS:1, partial [Racocetra persica]
LDISITMMTSTTHAPGDKVLLINSPYSNSLKLDEICEQFTQQVTKD